MHVFFIFAMKTCKSRLNLVRFHRGRREMYRTCEIVMYIFNRKQQQQPKVAHIRHTRHLHPPLDKFATG